MRSVFSLTQVMSVWTPTLLTAVLPIAAEYVVDVVVDVVAVERTCDIHIGPHYHRQHICCAKKKNAQTL